MSSQSYSSRFGEYMTLVSIWENVKKEVIETFSAACSLFLDGTKRNLPECIVRNTFSMMKRFSKLAPFPSAASSCLAAFCSALLCVVVCTPPTQC